MMNRKQRIKAAYYLLIGAVLTMGFTACSPDNPENEVNKKLHEDPFKAVITLKEGTLEGGKFNEKPHKENFKSNGREDQVIVWETIKGKGWDITSEKKKLKVKNTQDFPDIVYALEFEYFNVEGKPMNNQFFDNGQDKIHQHFFTWYKNSATGGKVRETVKENLPFDYNYADELNGTYIGETNPMGFFGFIRFVKPKTNFDMKIELLHAKGSKFDEENNKPAPFYLPSRLQRSIGMWDINITIPIEIE